MYKDYSDNYPVPEIPDGHYLYKVSCFVNVFRVAYDFPSLPSIDCTPIIHPVEVVDTRPETKMNLPNSSITPIYLFVFFTASVYMILFVEFMDRKFEYCISPIHDRLAKIVIKRYNFVKERERLQGMSPHP